MFSILLHTCRTVVLQQLEESGCEAMLELLSQLCAGLESARGERRKTLSALQVKRNQVDQFARITVSQWSRKHQATTEFQLLE